MRLIIKVAIIILDFVNVILVASQSEDLKSSVEGISFLPPLRITQVGLGIRLCEAWRTQGEGQCSVLKESDPDSCHKLEVMAFQA